MAKSKWFRYFLSLCLIGAASGFAYYQFFGKHVQSPAQEEAQECGTCTRHHTSMTRAIEARNQIKLIEKPAKEQD